MARPSRRDGTPRDELLVHQVVFLTTNHDQGHPYVSCNCRRRAGVEPMGKTVDLDESRELFNNPDYHVEPFTKEDEARW